MGTAQRTYRNTGKVACDGSTTVYTLTGQTLADALGLPLDVATRFFAQDERGGWNQITLVVTGISAKTWKVEYAVNDVWVELASLLPTDVSTLTHGVGPKPGVHVASTPSFRDFPAFRADAYRVTLSAADANGRIHIIAESFDS